VKYIKAFHSLIVITKDIAIEIFSCNYAVSRCHWHWENLAVEDLNSAGKGHADKIA
jgi:hypothetical protein